MRDHPLQQRVERRARRRPGGGPSSAGASPASTRSRFPPATARICSGVQPGLQGAAEREHDAVRRPPVGRVAGPHDVGRGREREQGDEVDRVPPRRVDQHVRVRRQHAPQPREIRDRGVGEDQRGVRVALRELHGQLAEGRDAAPGVDQHRHSPLAGQRDELGHRRLAHPELLGARVELDPARAGVERAPRLRERAVVRVDAAVRDEPVRVGGGRGQDRVVGGAVAVGLVHREHDAAGLDAVQRGQQLVRRLAVPVRVVLPDVRVRVVEVERARLAEQGVHPGACGRVEVSHADRPP